MLSKGSLAFAKSEWRASEIFNNRCDGVSSRLECMSRSVSVGIPPGSSLTEVSRV